MSGPANTLQRGTFVPGQTAIQRAAEVARLNQHSAPQHIVVDPSLAPGAWYVVRGLTPAERAVIDNLGGATKA